MIQGKTWERWARDRGWMAARKWFLTTADLVAVHMLMDPSWVSSAREAMTQANDLNESPADALFVRLFPDMGPESAASFWESLGLDRAINSPWPTPSTAFSTTSHV